MLAKRNINATLGSAGLTLTQQVTEVEILALRIVTHSTRALELAELAIAKLRVGLSGGIAKQRAHVCRESIACADESLFSMSVSSGVAKLTHLFRATSCLHFRCRRCIAG